LSKTLELLVKNEQGEKKKVATEGLVWLMRGLSFTCKALQCAQANTDKELSVAFSNSYEATLKKFHNFVVKGIFAVSASRKVHVTSSSQFFFSKVALKACPYRKDFFAKLAADPAGGEPATDERVNTELNQWLTALDAIVTRIQTYLETTGYGKGY
jgi:hypothetical protein